MNEFENILTIFVKKYFMFANEMISTEIGLWNNSNTPCTYLDKIKEFLDVEQIYWFIYWTYAHHFGDNFSMNKQDNTQGQSQAPSENPHSIAGSMIKSNATSSAPKLVEMEEKKKIVPIR